MAFSFNRTVPVSSGRPRVPVSPHRPAQPYLTNMMRADDGAEGGGGGGAPAEPAPAPAPEPATPPGWETQPIQPGPGPVDGEPSGPPPSPGPSAIPGVEASDVTGGVLGSFDQAGTLGFSQKFGSPAAWYRNMRPGFEQDPANKGRNILGHSGGGNAGGGNPNLSPSIMEAARRRFRG